MFNYWGFLDLQVMKHRLIYLGLPSLIFTILFFTGIIIRNINSVGKFPLIFEVIIIINWLVISVNVIRLLIFDHKEFKKKLKL